MAPGYAAWVIVTGAFLAEKAVAVDGLLHVWGGALSGWTVHPEYRWAEFMLVVLAQVQTGEDDRTITVEVIPPKDTARSLVMTREYPRGWPTDDVGFAIFRLPVHLEVDGRYVLLVASGGATISLPLTVSTSSDPDDQ